MEKLTKTTSSKVQVAIVGGGILGTLTALNLARLGLHCHILERRPGLWEGATLAGEGKIHLGYVYGLADDETLMSLILAATGFARDVEHAVGHPIAWGSMVSTPFDYGVPATSLISPEEFREHGRRISELSGHALASGSCEYLGAELRLADLEVSGPDAGRRFTTPERAVHVGMMRRIVCDRIRTDPNVSLSFSTLVTGAETNNGRWDLTTRSTIDGAENDRTFDFVVNCAWEGSARLDQMAGLTNQPTPNLRLRKFIHARSDGRPEALTLTLGPYGDFVTFADGRTYASWYPSGLSGFCSAVDPPPEWSHAEDVDSDTDFLDSVSAALKEWIPHIGSLRNPSVHARIVVASGSTDIDDPASELHRREPQHLLVEDNWISVKSYKLTTAATAARAVSTKIQGMLG